MGLTDRVVRILVATIVAILCFTGMVPATAAIILLILAGVLILTSLTGFCPLYLPFGISTNKKEN